MLDKDLAELYGVETRVLNQAIKRNLERFPDDFMFQLSQEEFLSRQQSAERALMAMGITFNVYAENEGTERIMPVDIIPRIVEAKEWEKIEKGLIQRITALNLFLNDIEVPTILIFLA